MRRLVATDDPGGQSNHRVMLHRRHGDVVPRKAGVDGLRSRRLADEGLLDRIRGRGAGGQGVGGGGGGGGGAARGAGWCRWGGVADVGRLSGDLGGGAGGGGGDAVGEGLVVAVVVAVEGV